ncbi:hypothetical protein BC830DRAFT_1166159 [Chytriomyces sp. MP71]|nr:hypothetical protein BC830DRAFT_1166159 [Chytriomyces sp. MP71]
MNSPFNATPAYDDTVSLDDISAWLSLITSGHQLDLSQYGITPSLSNISAPHLGAYNMPNNHVTSPPPTPLTSFATSSIDNDLFACLLLRNNRLLQTPCSELPSPDSPQSLPSSTPMSPRALVFPQPAHSSRKVVVRIQSALEPKTQLPPGKFLQGGVLMNTNARFQPYCPSLPNQVRLQIPRGGEARIPYST